MEPGIAFGVALITLGGVMVYFYYTDSIPESIRQELAARWSRDELKNRAYFGVYGMMFFFIGVFALLISLFRPW